MLTSKWILDDTLPAENLQRKTADEVVRRLPLDGGHRGYVALHCGVAGPVLLVVRHARITGAAMTDAVFQRCIHPDCGATCGVDDTAFACPRCGGLLDVAYDWDRLPPPRALRDFEAKWADRTNPAQFQRRLALPRAAAVRRRPSRS